ncbi:MULTISPECIES: family 6 glucosyltransferase [Methylomonas]|uniref:Glycosyl transferase family 6 n=2 Tax=Methylomonas TaxID=416 RepID=A0A140E5M5_9GAMM|nr:MULTISPECIES: family 6 glucosyltransferase [Methylomonas]AMK78699.1 hypothetical protein JT25_019765 [Methylomonas denitrificans]OAI03695.1 hypothetical protein A1342_01020 [Methylomonas methanica]TCV83548.1 glycosyl transferase family 6 [Methylomonas methanica]
MTMKIGILYICTGKYYSFWEDFYNSSEKYFLSGIEKKYFVFTDSTKIIKSHNVEIIHQDNLGWPFNTLYRYRMFLRIGGELKNFDYIIFLNANCKFIDYISLTDFFGLNKNLVACIHPGFFNKDKSEFTYEKRKKSKAFIENGYYYFPGGIMGGDANIFLNICKSLNYDIEYDLNNGIIAIWHDESYWNAHLNNNYQEIKDDLHILSPSYLYPEGWSIPFEKKVILRDKSKYIDIKGIKETHQKQTSILKKIRLIFP